MADGTCYLPVEILHQFTRNVFTRSGVPAEDAEIIADVLVASDLRGIESHGVSRLKQYYDGIKKGLHNPITQVEVLRETPTIAVIDGHNGMGHVVGVRAMQMAIEKARGHSLGAVAVRNSGHFGIAGYYVRMAVEAEMIGMAFTNARPSVAPTFGAAARLGTNPIAFGAPSDEECPFLFDAATSITQRGKIEILEREGKPTPAGWVIDNHGQYQTDTQKLSQGFARGESALLPLGGLDELMGGHKGFGLSTMVEMLCAGLQDNLYMHHLPAGGLPHQVGHFFLAIHIADFVPLETFKATAGGILRDLRATPKAPGHERIYTAGEKEYEFEKKVRNSGVAIPFNLQKELKSIQAELGLWQFDLPF